MHLTLTYFRHRSPYYYWYRAQSRYLAWVGSHRAESRCLYLLLGLLALAGVPIPKFFGKNLAAEGDLTPSARLRAGLPFPTGKGSYQPHFPRGEGV